MIVAQLQPAQRTPRHVLTLAVAFVSVLGIASGSLAAVPAAPAVAPPPPPPIASVPTIPKAASIHEMFSLGKPLAHLRLRFENADDESRLEDADVLSLRTALGFRTASFNGIFALAEFESVLALGDYDDGGTNRGMAPRY